MIRKLGWRKDKWDSRDFLHRRLLVLPDIVDLSAHRPDVRDQGNLGSCTGFGIGGNLSGTAKQESAYVEWFSTTWIYNGGRFLEGSLNEDSGCYPRDNLEFVKDYGCLLEHFRPYTDTLDKTDPTKWACAPEALNWPIISYTRCVDGVDGICSAIASGHLVSIGTPWYWAWEDTDADGNLAENYSSVAGGHETFLYGYDRVKQVFYGQNSWGTGWGKGGCYIMPFSAIAAFKADGGYDAHYVEVEWSSVPPPPPPPPPTPSPKIPAWVWILAGLAVAAIAAILIF